MQDPERATERAGHGREDSGGENSRSEARFRTLVEAHADIFWLADALGRPLKVTRWTEFTGEPYDAADGFGWRQCVHPDDRDEAEDRWSRALQAKAAVELEYRLRHHSGGYRYVRDSITPVLDDRGELLEWLGLIGDITERKTLEMARARLAAIVTSSEDAIISEDLGGTITSWNVGAEQMFGYPAAEAVGKHTTLIIPEEHHDEETMISSRLHRGERIEHYETVRRRKNGQLIDVSLTISPVVDGAGRIVGASKIVREVSERRQAEEMRARLAAIVESSDDAIVSKDLDGTIESWNRGAERLFGFTAEEAVGQHITLIIPEERHEEEAMILGRLRRGLPIDHFETVRRRKDGMLLDISLTVSPIVDPAGNVIGASKVGRNITERKRAEEALREHARALETIYGVATALTGELDSDRLIQVVVEAGVELCGAESGTFFAKSGGDTFRRHTNPSGPFPEVLQTHEVGILRAGEELLVRDLDTDSRFAQLGRQGGDEAPRSLLFVPVVSRTGELLGSLAFAHSQPDAFGANACSAATALAGHAAVALDNARLYESLEQKVVERTSELTNLNAELESFNYSVSHDLRAPLRGIDGFSQMLLEDYGDDLDDTAKRYLHRIRAATVRMGSLIDDLLDLSRLTRARIKPKELDLGELARSLLDELQESEPGRAAEWLVSPDLRTIADPALVRVALANLLENAWKFSRNRDMTRIEVGRTNTSVGVAFFVRDNGVGFDERYADKLFAPFQRLHKPQEFEGTGIGLATVQRVIFKHGGRLWAEGEPGRGATFYFTLPLATEAR